MSEDINIGAISEALNNKADRDLQNLDSTGSSAIDGQWIAKYKGNIYANTSINRAEGQHLEVDLSDYLPNDNYNYEIMVWGRIKSDNVVNHWSPLYLQTPVFGATSIAVALAGIMPPTANVYKACGSAILPIDTSRKFSIRCGPTYYSTIEDLSITGYRRIGTNS